jgi:CRP-like cAMP-binding protein
MSLGEDSARNGPSAVVESAESLQPSRDEIERLRTHPRFHEAIKALAAGMAEHYQGNRILNRLINDRARLVFGMMALDLHFTGQPSGEKGFSVTQAQDICLAHDICSAGRTTAMIALMRFAGYLEALPSRDRRVRLYGITDKLVASHHGRWRHVFAATSMVRPEGAAALAALARPAFTPAYVHLLARDFLSGVRVLLGSAPELGLFAERNCGMLILFSLIAEGADQGPVPVSISGLAHRFGVSRAHVTKLLRDAADAGFLSLSGAGAYQVAFTPRLIDAAQVFFATVFLYIGRRSGDAIVAMPADHP